jgi:hypothetical protein
MCEKCKNIHQRVQTTIEHKIIDIKTCGGVVYFFCYFFQYFLSVLEHIYRFLPSFCFLSRQSEHGGSVSDLSFTKLRPEIQEFVPGELNISKSFGILSSVKLANKSHDTELKVLKS